MNLLIVDDHPTNLKLLRAQLEAEGHSVVEAHDGVDALALLECQRVDAVISDILMPCMDGYWLCREIRKHARLHDLPIILYTSTYTTPADENLVRDMGADKYLKSPVSRETIVAALHEVHAMPHAAPQPKALQEVEVLKEYSERMVSKLEQKNTELQAQAEALTAGIAERTRAEALLNGQKRVLEMIAAGAPLGESLTELVRLIEAQAPGMLGSILLLDEDGVHLSHGAAPSLPPEYVAAIDGAPIGPSAGSCGTAAYSKEAVVVEDIATDPRWADYKAVALPHGLRACWSTPIFDAQRRVLGTFAMYYRQPALPQPDHQWLIDIAAHTAAIAIDRHRTEIALRESVERLRLAMQASNVGLWDWALRTNQVIYSSEWKSQLGYEEAEIRNEFSEWERLVHPDDLAAAQERIQRYLARQEGVYESEFRMRHKDGTWRWIYARGEFFRDASGAAVRMMGCHIDFTERKQADQKFKALLESAPDAMVIVNRDAEMVLVNAQAAKLFGWRREELLGQKIEILVPGRFRGAHQGSRKGFFAQPNVRAMGEGLELFGLRKDGTEFPVEISLSPLETNEGTLVMSAIRDITARKQADATVRQSEARLQEAQRIARLGNWDWDITTNALYWSDEIYRIFDLTPQQFIATYPAFLERVHPLDRSRVDAAVDAAVHAAAPYDIEHRIVLLDGHERTVHETGLVFRDETGRPLRMVGTVQDITARKELESQLRQAHRMESVGQLASGIAHDFNNLLTVINGMSDLVLAQVSQDDPVHADVQEIQRAGERAATLTSQLLAYSRQQILAPRELDFNTVVAGMESLFRRLLGEDIDLEVVLAPGVGSVKADLGQIEQVMTNLAVNARDAMPQGGRLTIETQNVTIGEDDARQHGVAVPPGSYVRLAVSDSGVGMDEATCARIFEPFFTTKGPGKGTGLGLATVYGIVKQSHGFIWVHSKVGQGTSFKIYLPQVTEAAGHDRPEPIVASSSGTETILLVEDNAAVRTLATRVLEPAGYTVFGAATGEEALRLLERQEEPVHLLLSDVVLPGMSGRQLAERLAQTRPGMKVLYMSGYTGDTIVLQGVLEAQMHFLNKPFTAAALLRKVREVLDF